ncbi:hypothetical protein NEPAR06_1714 [Nematocida parisii]|uniref:uncharacterized protein n=1 Tax=Nematocida parisii (strain ERTm1 / ATCC PRA-289) TaxID=881290 RepID=UPI000264BA8B|nr:uncharacterized protein NEPG_00421 [Nematocida parisii ERTm1]EIJ94896.1 hypothetical protein NEPG_00421 [Nematocida parisii ERTm1]KAI5155302.1 hypothetical protein NEPAR06_1714 [Nematocida parisii]KAI5158070.1 hypothetical protein NEPAR05_1840 [Nematocida parisii]|eukprot:XP_013058252.1 hypothetical protein NEPG_00421 [Nematocida parisii ERTm1]
MNIPDYESPTNYDYESGKHLVTPLMNRYTLFIVILGISFLIMFIICRLLIFCLGKSNLKSPFFRNIQWFFTCCGEYDKKNNNNKTNRNARSNSIDLTVQSGSLNNLFKNTNNPSSTTNAQSKNLYTQSGSSNNPSSTTNARSKNLYTRSGCPNNLDGNRNNNRVSNARIIGTTPSHYYSIVSIDTDV